VRTPAGCASPHRGRRSGQALDRLGKLLGLAERLRLYLDLTGLGCYHKKDVPAWYDKLSEKERWAVQARFWQAVAGRCAESPAVFCYDLMNEPVVPGGRRKDGEWLGPPFAGKHFVQFITLDQADQPRPAIARQGVHRLAAAIREKDKRHLLTVGLVDWSLDRKGLTSGFVLEKVADDLDFVSVHLYPKKGQGRRGAQDAGGLCGRQAGAGRGDVPPGLFPEGTGGLHRGVEEARRRLARLLLGQASRRATPVEDDLGCADAGLAGVVREEGEGRGTVTGTRWQASMANRVRAY
jgi:hypothetical protein